MPVNEQGSRYDRMAVRLSVIISRLLEGETLVLKVLSEEFGVSERTLRRDFHQRLLHLDIENGGGVYRLGGHHQRDCSPGAFSFIRTTGIARIIPVQDRQLMNLLMSESGTSPCLIWHAPLKPHVALPEFFSRLVQAISQQKQITILVEGQRHEALEPYRIIHYVEEWYLVVCQSGVIRVFALTTIGAVMLAEECFTRREEIASLTAGESFIAALPHFPLISDVINTFRY
ncbi:TPA: WYL domain-containing protein [Enterobacter hormaechei subsp. hoffmannii]|nr:WYL domain-containing protein [Enterobacter hormaechei subsp. hoffmannii]